MTRRRAAGCAVIVLSVFGLWGCAGEPSELERPSDAEDVLLEELALALNPEVPGLQPFFGFMELGDFEKAQDSLLRYFRDRPVPEEALPEPLPVELPILVSALDAWRGTFSFQGVRGRAAEPDGPIDWTARGPKDDAEWAWFLHRHYFLREMLVLYEEQGHEEFVRRIRDYLLDWFWRYPAPNKRSFSPSWRALEAARRITEAWLPLYDRLRSDPAFGDEAVLAILAGAARHADYLKEHHHFGGNHLVTEMMALATIAAVWPEFRNAPEWMDYAVAKGVAEMDAQVYPDGAHKELANHYQWIAGRSFQKLYEVVAVADRDEARRILRPRMESMWDYYAKVTRPDGTGPLNNDSDLEPNAEQIQPLAEYFDRPDWIWIATGGSRGEMPAGSPSQWFPWARHAVLRSDWSPTADWIFFDGGAFGTDHYQEDRLHLSAALGGRNILVDSGRYVYRDDAWSRFFRGPLAHNVPTFDRYRRVLPDGEANHPAEPGLREVDGLVLASGTIPLADGSAWSGSHSRAVVLGDGFVWIVDRVETARPDRVTFRWRFAPDLAVGEGSGSVGRTWPIRDGESGSRFASWSLRAEVPLAFETIRGRGLPKIQGWYSPEFNRREANTVLEVTAPVAGTDYFSWLLVDGEFAEGLMHRTEAGAVFLEDTRGGSNRTWRLEWPPTGEEPPTLTRSE